MTGYGRLSDIISFSDDARGNDRSNNTVADTLYQNIARWGADLGTDELTRAGFIVLVLAVCLVLLAIHNGTSSSWPWSLVAAAAFLAAAFDSKVLYRDGRGRPEVIRQTSQAAQDIYDHALRNTVGIWPRDKAVLHPHLYSIDKLRGKHAWLRGDPYLIAALNTLRPFSKHDGHRVRLILEMLGEFYRRYDRVLNRPERVHVKNEYTILHDLHLAVLNTIHELYFTKPMVLCANLPVVIHTVQARTYRMLRVLRHKYPCELRAVGVELGTAPRSFDAGWTPHDFFV